MEFTDAKFDVLQNLEFAIADYWRRHPDFTDFGASLAYEAAYERYRAEARGHVPRPTTLTGPELQAFESLCQICEFRLGRCPVPGLENQQVRTIPVDLLVDCLRELRKSVERHSKTGGRQGYLKFIEPFVR